MAEGGGGEPWREGKDRSIVKEDQWTRVAREATERARARRRARVHETRSRWIRETIQKTRRILNAPAHCSGRLRSAFASKYFEIAKQISKQVDSSARATTSSTCPHFAQTKARKGNGCGVRAVPRVAVLGAGSGAVMTAWSLKKAGCQVVLFRGVEDAEIRGGWGIGIPQAGVHIQSPRSSFLVLRNHRLRLLPKNVCQAILSPFSVLSVGGRVRLLLEPLACFFTRRKKDKTANETASRFFSRHYGKEFVDYVAAPLLRATHGAWSGVAAAYAARDATILDTYTGSLIFGSLAGVCGGKPKLKRPQRKYDALLDSEMETILRGKSFPAGDKVAYMSTLTQGFESELGANASIVNTFPEEIEMKSIQSGMTNKVSWRVNGSSDWFDAVVLALSPHIIRTLKIMANGSPIKMSIKPVSLSSMTYLSLSFKHGDLPSRLPFGQTVLIPECETKAVPGLIAIHVGDKTGGHETCITFVFGGPKKSRRDLQALAMKQLSLFDTTLGGSISKTMKCQQHKYIRLAYPIPDDCWGQAYASTQRLCKSHLGLYAMDRHMEWNVGDCLIEGRNTARRVLGGLLNQAQDSKTMGGASKPPNFSKKSSRQNATSSFEEQTIRDKPASPTEDTLPAKPVASKEEYKNKEKPLDFTLKRQIQAETRRKEIEQLEYQLEVEKKLHVADKEEARREIREEQDRLERLRKRAASVTITQG